MANNINLHISLLGKTEYEQGSKRIVAFVTYRGRRGKQTFEVYYYDKAWDALTRTTGCCCQSPTFASTEAGALRQINKFFNS